MKNKSWRVHAFSSQHQSPGGWFPLAVQWSNWGQTGNSEWDCHILSTKQSWEGLSMLRTSRDNDQRLPTTNIPILLKTAAHGPLWMMSNQCMCMIFRQATDSSLWRIADYDVYYDGHQGQGQSSTHDWDSWLWGWHGKLTMHLAQMRTSRRIMNSTHQMTRQRLASWHCFSSIFPLRSLSYSMPGYSRWVGGDIRWKVRKFVERCGGRWSCMVGLKARAGLADDAVVGVSGLLTTPALMTASKAWL